MSQFMEKPWGGYTVHAEGEGWLLKTLHMKAGEATSLQSHKLREERWLLVEGEAYLDVGEGAPKKLKLFEEVLIPLGSKHRLVGGGKDAVIVEVMRGTCLEEDIKRYEDKYGRV